MKINSKVLQCLLKQRQTSKTIIDVLEGIIFHLENFLTRKKKENVILPNSKIPISCGAICTLLHLTKTLSEKPTLLFTGT
jgi:hypothetical protein